MRFETGDIVERIKTHDPYDHYYNEMIERYGGLTYIVIDVKERYLLSFDKRYIVYKVICMQTDNTEYLSLNGNMWRKIG